MSTTSTSWTISKGMDFPNVTWSKNWTSENGVELTTAYISPENWTSEGGVGLTTAYTTPENGTDIDVLTNDTGLNISSIYLRNVSRNALSTIEQNSSPGLTYALLGLNAFFLAFGFFGNTAGVIVMLRSAKELKTHTLLVVVLAITDIGVLGTNSFYLLPSPLVFNFDTRAIADIGCAIFMAVDLIMKTNAAYITALICIDRFIAVQYPLQYKRIVSRNARIISLCICGGVAIFAGVVASSQYSEIENGICQLDASAHKTLAHLSLRFMMIALITAIPLVILLSLTPVIIYKISHRQTIRARQATKEEAARLIHTTAMLIGIVVAYIILVGVPTVVNAVLRMGGNDGNASNHIMLLSFVTALQINHSINIAFYLSNTEFREQLLRLFGCCCSASHPDIDPNQATPTDE